MVQNKHLNIIGLMTGTSMDGIDISLVQTNGTNLKRLNKNYYHQFSNKTKDLLLSINGNELNTNLKRKVFFDEIVTREHYQALINLDIIKDSDLIGFHGQTIYHNSEKKISIQLGDPKKLSKMLGKNVISDFRSNDIKFGGQGAPLAPIYHKLIIDELDLDLPSCILNIGGVSNLSYWDNKKLIGFDTGPGNALMDNYMKLISNQYFDKDGSFASEGNPNKDIIFKFINSPFFKKPPPKSLDRNFFEIFYKEVLNLDISSQDRMATFTEFTTETIEIAFKLLPKKPRNVIICGGGYKNSHLMERLNNKLNVNIIYQNQVDIEFDYIEAELIAYLAARSFYKLPYTFPSTTGTSKPLCGGKIYR